MAMSRRRLGLAERTGEAKFAARKPLLASLIPAGDFHQAVRLQDMADGNGRINAG
jgi:hypothetical protein